MNLEEASLYEAFMNYMMDQLLWSLIYLNNAVLDTPVAEEAKSKLLSLNQIYGEIISGIYPTGKGRELVLSMAEQDRFLVEYIDELGQGKKQTGDNANRWKESGRDTARILNELNPYWAEKEWNAMLNHRAELLQSIADGFQNKDYTILTKNAPFSRKKKTG